MDQKDNGLSLGPIYIEGYPDPNPTQFNISALPGMNRRGARFPPELIYGQVLFSEHKNNIQAIDWEYAETHKHTSEIVANESITAKNSAGLNGTLTELQRFTAEHAAILDLIEAKRSAYTSLIDSALSASGYMPHFMVHDIALKKIREYRQSSQMDEIRGWLSINGTLGKSYRAAHQLKVLAEGIRILSSSLDESGQQRDRAEDSQRTDPDARIATLQNRLQLIKQEIAIQVSLLPDFVQSQLNIVLVGSEHLTFHEQLDQYQTHSYRLAIERRQAAGNAQPTGLAHIHAPLSKPELESLSTVVIHQAGGLIDPLNAGYYNSVLHNESARYLESAATAFAQLKSRAAQADQLLNQAIAARELQHSTRATAQAQQAAESRIKAARRMIEASRTYAYTNSQAGSTAVSARGFGVVPFPGHYLAALQGAIRASASQLAGAGIITAGVVSGFMVGIFALAWPSSLGNGERRVALSTPLSDLLDTNGLDLEGIAARGESITLAHSLMIRPMGNQTHLFVVPVLSQVPVVKATWDEKNQQYSARLDAPPRIFTWTPAAPPGAQTSTSTSLPAEQLQPAIYTGAALMPLNSPVKVDVDDNDIDLGAQILVFPGTQLPPIFIMETRPPAEVLEVGGYNDLSSRSRKDGMDVDHIPSRRALERFLKNERSSLRPEQVVKSIKNAASIVIPSEIHRQFSETMGGRNSAEKQLLDAGNLENAVNSNFDAIKQGLLQQGVDETTLEEARAALHDYNRKLGWYE